MMSRCLDAVDTLILCGGQGTRLRGTLKDVPKVLAPIGQGHVFLDVLLDELASHGLRKFILCAGYLADQLEDYISRDDSPCQMTLSRETSPLGTGGAVRQALPLTTGDPLLVLNGDTICRVDLRRALEIHWSHGLPCSMVVSKHSSAGEYGQVAIASNGVVTSLQRRTGGSGLVNGGAYYLSKEALELLPDQQKFSFESDYLTELIARGLCFGVELGAEILDIGTPERYELARERYSNFTRSREVS